MEVSILLDLVKSKFSMKKKRFLKKILKNFSLCAVYMFHWILLAIEIKPKVSKAFSLFPWRLSYMVIVSFFLLKLTRDIFMKNS